MSVKPLWTSPPQFVDSNGDPYSGAFLYFYAAGSSTKQNVYTDSTGNTACDNPITLNSSGYPAVSGTILAPWGTTGQTYKIGLAAVGASDPPASFIWTADNVSPINDTAVTVDQWVSGATPTYIGATSFSLVGDQTSTYHVGRRLKTTNTAGTVYSTITASVYGVLTTITVANDSGTLDSGLSAVYYGILSATNPSTPLLTDAYPIVSGSSDKTKKVRLEVDGLTTATTRVLTVQDSDDTLVGRATTDTLTNKTLTSPTITTPTLNGALAGDAVAAQAEVETATATDSIVAPGRMHFHPAMPKALYICTNLGSTPFTLTEVYTTLGSATPTTNGTGDHTIAWTNSLTNPMVMVVNQSDSTTVARFSDLRNGSPAGTSARILTMSDAGSLSNPTALYVWVYGDLA